MTTTQQEFRQAAIQRVIERGGMPSFSDLEELRGLLDKVGKLLDEYSADALLVAHLWEDDVLAEIPFPVENEHVATLSLTVREVRRSVDDELVPFIESIEKALSGVEAARAAKA